MKALVVVDMLDDFVDGSLANPLARRIVEPIRRLLDHARGAGWVVVFSNDAHEPGDPELKVWGEHAMAGDPGARVIDELRPRPSEPPTSASPIRRIACPTPKPWRSSARRTRWPSAASASSDPQKPGSRSTWSPPSTRQRGASSAACGSSP